MSTYSPTVYWGIARSVNSNGRKQLMLVQLSESDSSTTEITTISTADKNITVYYVAKDALSTIGDNMSIPNEYQYNLVNYIFAKLYEDIDDDKAWKHSQRWLKFIKGAKKEANNASLEGGMTIIPHEY